MHTENALINSDLPRITLVIPTHKRRDLLKRCLLALLQQDYPAELTEIIVAHNFADDGTEAMVAQLRSDHAVPNLVYLRQSNPGPAMSRHNGALYGSGTLIAFIDDDCRAEPGWLRAGAMAFLAGHEMMQGATRPDPNQKRRYFEKTVSVQTLSPYFETCNIFYSRRVFENAGGFHGPFETLFWGEDTDLGWRVKQLGVTPVFLENARVSHEVFALSPWHWLKEALFLQNLPLLAKTWPGIRDHMYLGYFVHRQSAGFALALAGMFLAALLTPWALVACLPYCVIRFRETGRYANPMLLAARLVLGLPRAFVTFCVLAYGSVRHRTLLL